MKSLKWILLSTLVVGIGVALPAVAQDEPALGTIQTEIRALQLVGGLPLPVGRDATDLEVIAKDEGSNTWKRADDFRRSQDTDAVFSLQESEETSVRFGNGSTANDQQLIGRAHADPDVGKCLGKSRAPGFKIYGQAEVAGICFFEGFLTRVIFYNVSGHPCRDTAMNPCPKPIAYPVAAVELGCSDKVTSVACFAEEEGDSLLDKVQEVDILRAKIGAKEILLYPRKGQEKKDVAKKKMLVGVCHAKDRVVQAIGDIAKRLETDETKKQKIHSLNRITLSPMVLDAARERDLKNGVALYSLVRNNELDSRGWKVPEERTFQEARAILDEVRAIAAKEGSQLGVRHVRNAIERTGLGLLNKGTKISALAMLDLLCRDGSVGVKKESADNAFRYGPQSQKMQQQFESIGRETEFLEKQVLIKNQNVK